MPSKWINELDEKSFYFERDDSEEFYSVLERIDKLLKRAMHSTDDEQLHEDIRKEINGTD